MNNNENMISSLEIAEITGKKHSKILRDIRQMLESLRIEMTQDNGIKKSFFINEQGREFPEYLLNFELTMTLITGYKTIFRNRIIKKIEEKIPRIFIKNFMQTIFL